MRLTNKSSPARRRITAADIARCVLVTAASTPVAWLGAALLSHRTLPNHERIATIVFAVLVLGNAVRHSIRSWAWSGAFLSAILLFPAVLDRRCLLLASLAIPILAAIALHAKVTQRRHLVAAGSVAAGVVALLVSTTLLAQRPWRVANAWNVQWSMWGEQERLAEVRQEWERAIGNANVKELDEQAKRELEECNASAQAARQKEHQDRLQEAIALYGQAAGQLKQAQVSILLSTVKSHDSSEGKDVALAALGELLTLDPNHPEAIALERKIRAYFDLTVACGGGVTMRFALIPAGEFVMGSPVGEEGRDDNETQHKVTFRKPFYMQTTPVTQAQWQAVMGYHSGQSQGNDLPVEVTWRNAIDFWLKLRNSDGRNYRLPTEEEWEYACRAGSQSAYGGTGNLSEMGWYQGNSNHRIHPVAQKRPNAWNLYDMHGNVWEWCDDLWHGHGYTYDPNARNGSPRALRAGSWNDGPANCRSACRSWDWDYTPTEGRGSIGFRLCIDF